MWLQCGWSITVMVWIYSTFCPLGDQSVLHCSRSYLFQSWSLNWRSQSQFNDFGFLQYIWTEPLSTIDWGLKPSGEVTDQNVKFMASIITWYLLMVCEWWWWWWWWYHLMPDVSQLRSSFLALAKCIIHLFDSLHFSLYELYRKQTLHQCHSRNIAATAGCRL